MNERAVERYIDFLAFAQDCMNGADRRTRTGARIVRSSAGTRAEAMAEISERVSVCTRCELHRKRSRAVPGTGVSAPDLLVVGEAPGADEDAAGLPFVGPAGRYLDKWLSAIGMSRDSNCFIANVVKCRPPGNRDPEPDERSACMPYLEQQMEILAPRAVLALGRIAAQTLLGTTEGIGRMRGRVYAYRGVPLVPTYHPSAVLRNPEYRQGVWDDLRRLKTVLEEREAGE